MFNLIKKDLLLQKHLGLVYLGLIVLYLYIDISLVGTITLTCSLFVLHSHYYDEKDHSNMLLNSLPYSRKEIVTSKFLEAVLAIIPVSIVSIVSKLIFTGGDFELSYSSLLISLFCTMIFTSFYLPFFYKFTQQYIMMIGAALMGLTVALMPIITRFVTKHFSDQINTVLNMSEIQLYTIFGGISVLLFVLSWNLTVSIYSKRVF